jgi:hypothetical protein
MRETTEAGEGKLNGVERENTAKGLKSSRFNSKMKRVT